MRLLKQAALLLILLAVAFQAASAEDLTGAVARVPFPINAENISLEKQKVEITVYSTFIQVECEYLVKNNNKDDVSLVYAFPQYLHSVNIEDGEMPVLGFKARTGKKDEEYYVRQSVEGSDSRDADHAYTRWYKWDMDINGGRTAKIFLTYFIKMDRKKGVPNFAYAMKQAKAYTGNIKDTEIIVNMPVNCKDLSFTTQKLYTGGSYIFTSLPKPKVTKNILYWSFNNMEPGEDLEVYFSKLGYPAWEITASSQDAKNANTTSNLMDGDPRTYWSSEEGMQIEGSWLEFKPFMYVNQKDTKIFEPKIYKIAIIPGNGETLSKFYEYSHLKDAEVSIRKEKKVEPDKDKKNAAPVKQRKKAEDEIISVECGADWTLQEFGVRKYPLSTMEGPLRLTISSFYQGQKFKNICISEILIFDRRENEVYDDTDKVRDGAY
ncbi:MAG: hypothetical protein LWY06_06255 [Firmicutes bacterium]|nr:hypothetical protein [Bacillota bacterium]